MWGTVSAPTSFVTKGVVTKGVNMNWYYRDGDQQVGPVADEAMQALIRTGVLSANTPVWREGLSDWTTLAQSDLSVVPRTCTQPTLPTTQNRHRLFWLGVCALGAIAVSGIVYLVHHKFHERADALHILNGYMDAWCAQSHRNPQSDSCEGPIETWRLDSDAEADDPSYAINDYSLISFTKVHKPDFESDGYVQSFEFAAHVTPRNREGASLEKTRITGFVHKLDDGSWEISSDL